MTDHDLLIEDIGNGQRTEQLRERLVDSNILILMVDLSLEAIDHVDLFSLMIAPSHMQELFIRALPSNQRQHALHRERPPVHEVPVEEVLVGG